MKGERGRAEGTEGGLALQLRGGGRGKEKRGGGLSVRKGGME